MANLKSGSGSGSRVPKEASGDLDIGHTRSGDEVACFAVYGDGHRRVHSVVYKPGIEPIPVTGEAAAAGTLGTFVRGLRRISGVLFSYDGSAAEGLFGVTSDIDLIIRYRANGQKRKRTLANVLFVGDAAVMVPAVNDGTPELIGVPFRVQIPEGDTLAAHVVDATDP